MKLFEIRITDLRNIEADCGLVVVAAYGAHDALNAALEFLGMLGAMSGRKLAARPLPLELPGEYALTTDRDDETIVVTGFLAPSVLNPTTAAYVPSRN